MDFVEWCDFVLKKLVEASRVVPTARQLGVEEWRFAPLLYGEEISSQPGFRESTYFTALWNALHQLEQIQMVERKPFWRVTRSGREAAPDTMPVWWQICQERLDEEYKQLLHVINCLSPHTAPDHAWLEEIERSTLVAELEWPEDSQQLWSVAQDLKQWELINGRFYMGGGMRLSATYRGLVWETRRGLTLESKFIDDLVAEWETTSVDFKRELYTDTADQKAELIKDILSLVNTQASGRRWLIIGFDDRTRQHYSPPDPKIMQNRLEQIMKQYTSPMVDIRYEVVDYRQGRVGKLEILRDPKKLPYRVAKSLGEKKRIEQDRIFVRHGSQVEEPTTAELQAIQEEGNRARSIS
jgi:hypothetical protein